MTRFATTVMAALALVGCGGGSGGSSSSGVDPNIPVPQVNASEKAELCDWYDAQVGGYGTVVSCGASYTITVAFDNQAMCIQYFPVCDATVGQLEDCTRRLASAWRRCDLDAAAAAYDAPSCVAASGCVY